MGFLDKLKPQPRWKHADPAIRLEALRELDDPVELGLLAESDPDARVRRTAVVRVVDANILGRLAGSDPDLETRERALDRLVAFACRVARSTEDTGDLSADPVISVRQIADQRRLSVVAKSEASEAVRADALSRITDERALSGIARQAKRDDTAIQALARLSNAEEILEVALNASSSDVAVGAFDRWSSTAPDLTKIRAVESRTQQKAVARRARTLVHEIEAAEAARVAALEERRRRESALCDAVEQVASIADLSAAAAELGHVTDAWSMLSVTDASLMERFERGRRAAEQSIVRREREAAEAADIRRLRAEAIATRDALCARVETLDGGDSLDQLVPIEEEWRSLLPLVGNGPEADRLAVRFAQAVAACRKRHEMGAQLAETRVTLETLVAEAEGLSSDDPGARERWEALSREARGLTAVLTAASRPADELIARLDATRERFAEAVRRREVAAEAAAEHARQDALRQVRHLLERAKRTFDADTITLREGDRLMRDISAAYDLAHKAPVAREIDEAVAELRRLQEQLAPRVREVREMDEWRRFANAQRQEQLIAMAEAIVQSLKADDEATRPSDLAATARALRELHAKWQEVAEAPRQNAQRLWDRFRAATDFIRARCEVYFAKVREERAATLEKKAAIVTEAEALANSSDWTRAATRFQQLQVEWQALGPVSRDSGRDLAQRFRAACSTFFTRRREDLTERKKTWSDNLSKKEALCARAEELADSTDWESAASELKRLQAEWKTLGPVRRNKSEVVWNRFRAAADRFFTRFHNRHQITLAAKIAEREVLVVELERLAESDPNTPDLGERVQQLRTTWNRSVPIPVAEFKALTDRWHTALTRTVAVAPQAFAGTDLDPAMVIQRMEKLVGRVEAFLEEIDESTDGLSHTELLAAKLRSALATNAMGGRVNEDAKWRAATDAVKDAQAAWQRLAPTHSPAAEALRARFREACRRISERARRVSSPGPGERERRSPERQAAAV
jgi:hypothetical protein